MDLATTVMDDLSPERKCLSTAEALENIGNSEAFDGIVLLICRDVFEFFQKESGNCDDSYHDIYVVPTCTELQNLKPIKSSFEKDNNKEKDVFHNDTLMAVKKEIQKECDSPPVTDTLEADEINGEAKQFQSTNGCIDDRSSGSDSTEDSSDDSENDKMEEEGDSGEESEDTLRSRLLNKLLSDKKNRKLLKSLRKYKKDKRDSKLEKNSVENDIERERQLSRSTSKERNESSPNQEQNLQTQINDKIRSNTFLEAERKRTNDSFDTDRKRNNISTESDRKRNFVSSETSPRKRNNTNNEHSPWKRNKRCTDMSTSHEDLKHNSKTYSTSPRSSASSHVNEKFGTKSTKYKESMQYTWKRNSGNWDDTYLSEKNKFTSPERRPWKGNFRSDNYEESKYQKVNNHQRNYSKYRNYTHW